MAADWPLRGTVDPGYARWDGWQFGVLAGYGNMNVDFGNSTSPLVASILRNTTLEAEGVPSSWTTLQKKSEWSGVRCISCLQLAMERARHRR